MKNLFLKKDLNLFIKLPDKSPSKIINKASKFPPTTVKGKINAKTINSL